MPSGSATSLTFTLSRLTVSLFSAKKGLAYYKVVEMNLQVLVNDLQILPPCFFRSVKTPLILGVEKLLYSFLEKVSAQAVAAGDGNLLYHNFQNSQVFALIELLFHVFVTWYKLLGLPEMEVGFLGCFAAVLC